MTDTFGEFLAPGVSADDVEPLWPLLRARSLLSAFVTLFRGGDDEVMARLLVLREIGGRAEAPRWSPEELRRHFSYLDPVKLETVLARLRGNALLAIGEDGQYELSDVGRNAVAAVSMLVQFSSADDLELGFLTAQLAGMQATGTLSAEALSQLLSKLNDLTWHFEEAIASGSEFRIGAARQRLQANLRWIEKGTDTLNRLLADPDMPFETARLAQRIGLAQSRLARVDAAFQRAMNKIEAQRVTLGASGLSSSDVAVWLAGLAPDAIAGLAAGALGASPQPTFLAGGHELLDRAETVLSEEIREREADTALPPAAAAPPAPAPEEEDLRLLTGFTRRLEGFGDSASLGQAVAGGGFAPASYRLSLLAMLADDADAGLADGPIADFMRQPFSVLFAGGLERVGSDEIASVSTGHISRRAAPADQPTNLKGENA